MAGRTQAVPPNKLKNRRSESKNTFEAIEYELTRHGARNISFDYTAEGKRSAITFVLVIQGHRLTFHLPARVANVEKILARENGWPEDLTPARKEQAFRTTWANIRDWIAAQMALVDSEMVKTEEVFLPYLVAPNGQTLFYILQEQQFLLPAPRTKVDEVK